MLLTTFYVLFKSNSADVIKANKEVAKSTEEVGKKAKEAAKETEDIGKAYTKMIEGATQALTAFVSVRAFAGSLFNTAMNNSSLQVQSKLIGQSTVDLKAYGAAIEAAGGSSDALRAHIQGLTEQFAEQGLKLPPIEQIMQKYRNTLKQAGGDVAQQQMIFQKFGITDAGQQSLLLLSDEEYEKKIAQQREFAASTLKGAQTAREFAEKWSNVKQALDGVWTSIGEDLLPAFSMISDALVKFFGFLAKHQHLAEAVFAGAAVGALALSGALVTKLIPALATVVGIAAKLPMGLLGGLLSAGGAVVGLGGLIVDSAVRGDESILGKTGKGISEWIDNVRGVKRVHNTAAPSQTPVNRASMGRSSLSQYDKDISFWMSKGYSKEQAAAWAAAAHAESGGNPRAVGDGGRAKGLFQWHPDRRANILKGTGIDITTATYEQQLEAAAWEAQQRGDDRRIKSAGSAQEAAAIHTKYFERPADTIGESIKRGQLAMDIANKSQVGLMGNVSGGGDKNISVKTGDINIHTNATDANGIAGELSPALTREIRMAMSNLDDGVNQ